MRTFKLNRILETEILREEFQRRDLPDVPGASDGEYPEITLRFPGEMAYRVYDEFDKTRGSGRLCEDAGRCVADGISFVFWDTGGYIVSGTFEGEGSKTGKTNLRKK